jgi:GR25 family glycosyltransferase involved in LPS biosynthesis
MLDKYFDKCYIINLPKRIDRLERAKKNCNSIGLVDFKVFPAIDGNNSKNIPENINYDTDIGWLPGAVGLVLTTLKILKEAKKNKYDSILIMEDDVQFYGNFQTIFPLFMREIPQDWELIQVGASHLKLPQRIGKYSAKILDANCLHCYAIRDTVYDILIEECEKLEKPIDWITNHTIVTREKSYSPTPNLAIQYADYSNIGLNNVFHYYLNRQ